MGHPAFGWDGLFFSCGDMVKGAVFLCGGDICRKAYKNQCMDEKKSLDGYTQKWKKESNIQFWIDAISNSVPSATDREIIDEVVFFENEFWGTRKISQSIRYEFGIVAKEGGETYLVEVSLIFRKHKLCEISATKILDDVEGKEMLLMKELIEQGLWYRLFEKGLYYNLPKGGIINKRQA